MFSVLITGTSRGIGFNLVKNFLKKDKKPDVLICTVRDPSKATELRELADEHSNLKILTLDVTDTDSFAAFASKVEEIVGPNGLNVLVNNAGYGITIRSIDDERLTVELYKNTIQTNLIGRFFLIKTLLPLLRRAAQVNKDKPLSIQRAAIINISAYLGSVSLNVSDTNYFAYSESKAALNQVTRSLHRVLLGDGIIVVPLHPGWVRTEMGGEYADISVEESTEGLVNVIYNLNENNNGKFLAYNGSEIAW